MRALSTFRNLTGGRLPPLTRTALLCGLVVFLLTLVVFRPGAGGEAPAQPLSNGVRLVAPGDARTESVVLLDTSAVYFPGKSSLGGAGRGIRERSAGPGRRRAAGGGRPAAARR